MGVAELSSDDGNGPSNFGSKPVYYSIGFKISFILC